MLDRVFAACLKNIVKADDVGFDIDVGIGDRIAHTRLCRQIDDDRKTVLVKQPINERTVSKIAFDERPRAIRMLGGKLVNFSQAVLFDGYVIVIIHIIKSDDPDPLDRAQKLHDKIGADKACGTRYEDRFVLQIDIWCKHLFPL